MKDGQPEDGLGGRVVVPVTEEVPVFGKRTVTSGRVRIDKTVTEHDVVIDEPLLRRAVHVERIAIGRDLADDEELPSVRYDGDTTIIPVLHEVPVVTKKIVLVEEIRITRVTHEVRQPETVTVRAEQVSLVREQDEPSATPPRQG